MRYEALEALASGDVGRMGMSRRDFLAALAAGTAAVSGMTLLPGCATGSTATRGGTGSLSKLAGVLPSYIPVNYVKPDFPGVSGSPRVCSGDR